MTKVNGRNNSGYPVDFTKVALKECEPLTDLWLTGYVRGFCDLYFQAKVYDRNSKFGIYGSRVSKLEIRRHGETVVQYDRGWVVRPPSPDHYEIVNKLISAFPQPTVQQYRDFRRQQRDRFAALDRLRAQEDDIRPPKSEIPQSENSKPMDFFQQEPAKASKRHRRQDKDFDRGM